MQRFVSLREVFVCFRGFSCVERLCLRIFFLQADLDPEVGSVQPKKRTFKKFTFRGVDLDALLDMSSDELVELFHARARRRFVLYTCTTVENVLRLWLLSLLKDF